MHIKRHYWNEMLRFDHLSAVKFRKKMKIDLEGHDEPLYILRNKKSNSA